MAHYLPAGSKGRPPGEINRAKDSAVEQTVGLKPSVPVIITYYTGWVYDQGVVHFADDIYGHDKQITAKNVHQLKDRFLFRRWIVSSRHKTITVDIKTRQRKIMEQWATNITRWVGSTTSVILHTLLFITSFALPYLGIVTFERMLLVLTTIVSLEAIYLSIFIQMSLNLNNQNIEILQEDIEEIGEDLEEIGEDIEEIQKDVDEIQEDVDEIQEETSEEQNNDKKEAEILLSIQATLVSLQKEIEQLKISNK